MRPGHDDGRLPGLRPLQVFEAAARHESFTRAAETLHITQGAVSRQVQELERWLGCCLFVRSGPNLSLTATGRRLGTEVTRALDILATAVAQARPNTSPRHVTLSMLPSVAAKWLAPRLDRFIQTHPQIDLRVTASRYLVDFVAEEVDAAIRYGKGNWPGVAAHRLGEETVTPVCTRAYAEAHELHEPADLYRATLLHSDIEENWEAWFRAAGFEGRPVPRGPRLGDDTATLQAAQDGQGVALGRSILIADDVNVGRLISLFPILLPASYSYWFVIPTTSSAPIDLDAVHRWLKTEFEHTSHFTADR